MTTDRPALRKRGLGMGLSALLGDDDDAFDAPSGGAPSRGLQTVPIELLQPSPLQPRKRFPEAELEGLAQSLREKGVLQPLVVRPVEGNLGGYEIVAGERRWRAAQRAGLHELPVVVRELGDREVLELALVENLQREDLSPLEEAEAYHRLIEELGHTQEEIGRLVGKSRSHIANTLRLLALPAALRELVETGKLTAGHARALLGAKDPERLAREVVERDLNVRATEELVRRESETRAAATAARTRDPNLAEVEDRLSTRLGLEVAIHPRRQGGRLEIRYTDSTQLEALLERLSSGG